MKYVLAYYGGGMAETPEEQAKVMEAWGAWFGGLGPNLLDGGVPFTGNVKGVSSDGSVSDGPIGERATGYSIVSADNLDAATEIARGCPVLSSGGSIAVYEGQDMM
ncbi:MAG TPA: hypothetical protein VNV65_11165 [Candidatus Solibacter sp.]|jgi:hypothetical protein|nr:hypothetical protein [Candidatus Solibacter sp.]